MSLFYRAKRVGKNGKSFEMLKLRTLKEGSDKTSFPKDQYTRCGKFLRKWRIDEVPQFWNVLRGDMAIVGPRPEEQKTIGLYPEDTRKKLLSVKPGMFGLAGIYFIDEEELLKSSSNPADDYWTKIKPMKLTLDFFYIENRCIFLDLAIIWIGIKKALGTLWSK